MGKLASDIKLRTEFSFIVSDPVLASIRSDIAKANVNIAASFITRANKNKNIARIVPGGIRSESKRDVQIVRKILQAHKIHYKEVKVISISPNRIQPGVPGGFSNLYNSLWCRVNVVSYYHGEGDYIYLNVSDVKKTLAILSKKNVKPCPIKKR